MSESNGQYPQQDLEVEDAEKYIDRAQKTRLLDLRKQIDEWSKDLFSKAKLGEIDESTAVSLWGDRVRDYLVAIEPIAIYNDFSLPGSKTAFLEEEMGIVEVLPPDEITAIADQRRSITNDGRSVEVLDSDPPVSKKTMITGLKSVIENERVTEKWSVQVRQPGATGSARRREIEVENSTPVNRLVLRNAVRAADAWLQEIGIGIETDSGLERDQI